LGIGILLDATIIRALLVPALVSLFGKWNWWYPPRLARAMAVRVPGPETTPVEGERVPIEV
jgi:RND superfamily putative drug exporter